MHSNTEGSCLTTMLSAYNVWNNIYKLPIKNKSSYPKFLSVWQIIFKIIVVPCID